MHRTLSFINILRLSALKLRAYVRLRYGGYSSDADVDGDVDIGVPGLGSVVAYLRKENEIADLQLELSKQVNVHLKAQIEHLRLQATRTTIIEVGLLVFSTVTINDIGLGTGTGAGSGEIGCLITR
jgi:hypothetical protein